MPKCVQRKTKRLSTKHYKVLIINYNYFNEIISVKNMTVSKKSKVTLKKKYICTY